MRIICDNFGSSHAAVSADFRLSLQVVEPQVLLQTMDFIVQSLYGYVWL